MQYYQKIAHRLVQETSAQWLGVKPLRVNWKMQVDAVVTAAGPTYPAPPRQLDLDKPIYTISVAAEILETHPRTLMMYESLRLVVPRRTSTNRRRYSQRDVLTLQAIQRLTRRHGLNLAGARYVIQCLRLLDQNRVPRPAGLADVDIEHVNL